MSNELMRLAWKVPLKMGPKVVLVALADKADKTGVCWPSRDLLCEMTGASLPSLSRYVGELIADGYVTQTRRRATSAVYQVHRDRLIGAPEVSNRDIETSQIETSQSDISTPPDISNRDIPTSQIETETSQIETSLLISNPQEPSTSENVDDAPREEHPEARKLCERLGELMTANGSQQPTIGKRALDAARLLLTKDRRPFPEAVAVLEWSQADTFWQDNIHSMPTFRKQYDKLRGRADKDGALTAKHRAPTDPDGITEWVREQWRLAAVSAIEQATGLRYEPPDLPLHITTKADAETFQCQHRQQWIAANHDQITQRLAKGDAA